MGNRVYTTIKSNNDKKTYYLHWNGGLDTWLPVVNVAFKEQVKTPSKVAEFINYLGVKIEEVSGIKPTDTEENGHYFIDLEKQTFKKVYRIGGYDGELAQKRFIKGHFKQSFENLLANYDKEHRDKIMESYWTGISHAGLEFFDPKATKTQTKCKSCDLWFSKDCEYSDHTQSLCSTCSRQSRRHPC